MNYLPSLTILVLCCIALCRWRDSIIKIVEKIFLTIPGMKGYLGRRRMFENWSLCEQNMNRALNDPQMSPDKKLEKIEIAIGAYMLYLAACELPEDDELKRLLRLSYEVKSC